MNLRNMYFNIWNKNFQPFISGKVSKMVGLFTLNIVIKGFENKTPHNIYSLKSLSLPYIILSGIINNKFIINPLTL